MIEARGGPRLVQQSLLRVAVVGAEAFGIDEFEGNASIETQIAREIHRPHPTAAQGVENLVRTDASSLSCADAAILLLRFPSTRRSDCP
jgi:hypothetical protein